MFVTLLYINEILKVVFYLSAPIFLVCMYLKIRKELNEEKSRIEKIVDGLLEKADDEKPIVFNVSQERLIKRTADEMEKRQRTKEMFK